MPPTEDDQKRSAEGNDREAKKQKCEESEETERTADSKEEPTGIGHSCFDDVIYAQVEKLYTEHSNHADHICSFVESNVLPNLHGYKDYYLTFLDVGAGPGIITRRLAEHFDRVTVIEPNPNPEYLATYSKAPNTDMVVNSPSTLEDATINDDDYDLILCSHVLYHVPTAKWVECLIKLCLGLRRPAGRLLVALTAPRGSWHELQLSLRPGEGSNLHTGTLRSKLDGMGVKYETHPIKCRVVVSVDMLPGFTNLVRLFAIADTWSAEEWNKLSAAAKAEAETKIEAYIHGKCFVEERNEYMLETDEDYVVVSPLIDPTLYKS